nr:hypothetical protein [Bacteroidia bacterium]
AGDSTITKFFAIFLFSKFANKRIYSLTKWDKFFSCIKLTLKQGQTKRFNDFKTKRLVMLKSLEKYF